MVEQRQAKVGQGVRPTGENHRATPFELFFDLVYVFAVTQVTGYMANEHSAHGVLRGLLMLALLWGTWSGYTWLGNHSRADEGFVRAGMVVAMAAMFVVALTIPEAWRDSPGGLNGPLVLVCAYLLVRCVHLTVYAVAATGDAGLRHQVVITWLPMAGGAALLVAGVLLGGWTQTLLFTVALLVDWLGIYLTARRGGWRLHSPMHLTERHGLFIILAIGESVVAIGGGAADRPISTPLLFRGHSRRRRRRLPVVAVLRRGVTGGRAPARRGARQGPGQPGGRGVHVRAFSRRGRHRAGRPRR
ncbi:hypothetical protein Acor_46730 [Acrocarpospora corrugata]|uniref:Low temperature requirement protein A n=1 Tax=Acrocarpospora corrugata TaxID=35763 RepID=A0A5M3W0F9_9ACTN|nr:hypothetical protein Acor_46730 [Acrocarpospora corrugata]